MSTNSIMNCTKPYDQNELKRLYNEGMLKDRLDAKQYFATYFHPLNNGTHALIENEQVMIIQKETMNDVYLTRVPDDIKKWYKKETVPKSLICEVNQPTVGDKFINISKTLKHKYEEYDKMVQESQEGVELMLSYIKEVWANNNDTVYNYIMLWLAYMAQGKKNKTCIYAKAMQGIGKSTLIEFLRDFVLGKDITCKGKSDHLKGAHNLQLMGRLFVYFEELQIFSDHEWFAIDSELKDLITDDWASYTDKYEKRFEAQNINNYMIITNSTIKGVHQRRYLVLDLNPKRMDDFAYFSMLRKKCFNDAVGKAFFCYLKEIDTSKYNSLELPDTKNKLEMIAEFISPIEKFLKFNFVLRNCGIKMKVKHLHEMFKDWDSKNSFTSIQKFCQLMRELGFEYKADSNGYNIYEISYHDLESLAKKRKWLHELDKDVLADNTTTESMFSSTNYIDKADKAVYIRIDDHAKIINNLTDRNEALSDDLQRALNYIKELERYCNKENNTVNEEKRPTKRIVKVPKSDVPTLDLLNN